VHPTRSEATARRSAISASSSTPTARRVNSARGTHGRMVAVFCDSLPASPSRSPVCDAECRESLGVDFRPWRSGGLKSSGTSAM
jgi:hypothetical protein